MNNFTYSYKTLDKRMYSELLPIRKMGKWVLYNHQLSESLHIDLYNDFGLSLLTRSTDHPYYAYGYAGHQFGSFTILGDGRACNIGDVSVNNDLYEMQLKGSGLTPYSRRGDGLATLYSMLREYLVSEALFHLNVPTTRTLAIIQTEGKVMRNTVEQGAIATRVALSHLRIGSIQYAKAMGGDELVKSVVDYAIDRHFPDVNNDKDKYLKFFKKVVLNQALLVAKWQSIGFIHGVLNTDNVLISGQSIDFGPCAFMDQYDPQTVFSSIDQNGRYQYQNQPAITSWNMARLAEVIIPLIHTNKEEAITLLNRELQLYEELYTKEYYDLMSKKLGLSKSNQELVDELLIVMYQNELDYTNTFYNIAVKDVDVLNNIERFNKWHISLINMLEQQSISKEEAYNIMKKHNPVIIPRNHVLEEALLHASKDNDYTLFNKLLEYIKEPFNYEVQIEDKFKQKNPNNNYITYCGT